MMTLSSTTIVSFPELDLGPWTIDRYLVKDLFGKISIAWYGVIICVAMILACAVILRNAVKREGFNVDTFLDYFLVAIPVGIVGARCMYVASKWNEIYHDASFLEIIAVWNGGIAIYGAVIAGALAIFLMAKLKKQNPLKVYDAIIPGLLLAQAIGRWGNFVNGEAFGETVRGSLPWGMIVNGIGPVHPTFLYESIITFSGFLLANFLIYRLKKTDGQVFCFYLVWYGIGRVLVEGLRTDSLMVGSFRLAQCIGVATALLGVALFVILQLYKTLTPDRKPVLAEGEEEKEKNEEEKTSQEISSEEKEKDEGEKENENGSNH